MNLSKPVLGLDIGGALGLLDGQSGFLAPSLAPVMGSVIAFSLLKGLQTGSEISEEFCQVENLIFSTGPPEKFTPPPQFSHAFLAPPWCAYSDEAERCFRSDRERRFRRDGEHGAESARGLGENPPPRVISTAEVSALGLFGAKRRGRARHRRDGYFPTSRVQRSGRRSCAAAPAEGISRWLHFRGGRCSSTKLEKNRVSKPVGAFFRAPP